MRNHLQRRSFSWVRSFAAWALAVVFLAGCGGSSGHGTAETELTVPAYGPYPPITIPVAKGTPASCRSTAQAFTRAAVSFLPELYEADEFFFRARLQYFEFKAHRCDVAILRKALSRRLSMKQRRELVTRLGFLSEIGRELVEAPPR